MRANRLIRTGQTFDLGQPLKPGMPLIGNRRWDMQITHDGRPPRPGPHSLTETLWTAIGQVGTQLDGFGHQMIGDSFYNCVKIAEVGNVNGIDTLGPDVFGTLMTRGVLIDVAALKGVDVLGDTYAITAQDLQDALARQNLTIQPGDAVLIRTGWGQYWMEDPVKYLHSSPGLRLDAEEWLVEQDPMIVSSDNCCIEVRPVGVGPLIHTFFIVVHGIVVIENLKLDELAAAGANEFAFVVQPLPMWGATGSTVAPTAIR
jgi:kynurenine formamidase